MNPSTNEKEILKSKKWSKRFLILLAILHFFNWSSLVSVFASPTHFIYLFNHIEMTLAFSDDRPYFITQHHEFMEHLFASQYGTDDGEDVYEEYENELDHITPSFHDLGVSPFDVTVNLIPFSNALEIVDDLTDEDSFLNEELMGSLNTVKYIMFLGAGLFIATMILIAVYYYLHTKNSARPGIPIIVLTLINAGYSCLVSVILLDLAKYKFEGYYARPTIVVVLAITCAAMSISKWKKSTKLQKVDANGGIDEHIPVPQHLS